VTSELEKASRQTDSKIRVVYINCKMKKVADTEYRLLANIAKELGKDLPFTGLPTDQVYKAVFELIDSEKQTIVLIIDEIDNLVRRNGDEILYNLCRINSELKNARLSIIGITNELGFINNLDPRVRSSLSEEEFVFPPYNATQLKDILRQRASIAFREGAVADGVIEKCAALAAQEHGDARRALDLLRVAGELAERKGAESIEIGNVDAAQEKVDLDRVVEAIKAQPRQSQAVLLAITKLSETQKAISTGDVFEEYAKLCNSHALNPLTQRRVSDLIEELNLFGIIQTRVVSKGRYGRTRTIALTLGEEAKKKVNSLLNQIFF